MPESVSSALSNLLSFRPALASSRSFASAVVRKPVLVQRLKRPKRRNRSLRAASVLTLSHFRTENRIPPPIKSGAGFFLKMLRARRIDELVSI
jgi:hypothetical protein